MFDVWMKLTWIQYLSASDSPFKLAIAYFDSLESINAWRQDSEHIAAKNKARSTWLEDWQIRIYRIENVYGKSY